LIDRELYLPESWIADRDRCRRTGIPDEVEFATKPRQAMEMLARVFCPSVERSEGTTGFSRWGNRVKFQL
jgi:hypothetical protein